MKKIIYSVVPVSLLFFACINLGLSTSPKPDETTSLNPRTTIIVLPGKIDNVEFKAAQSLNIWLKKIYRTDSGFRIIRENSIKSTDGQFIIAVGKTRFSSDFGSLKDLSPYSFIIQRNGEVLSIQGVTPTGTLLASGYFLDHFCGVRFYMPGDLFTSMPERRSVQLQNEIIVKEIPFTREVYTTGFMRQADIDWAGINGLIRKDWQSHQHTMGDRFVNDTTIKKFPEIFPTYKGQRYIPASKNDQNWQPDFAEPSLVDAAVYSAINYFKANPGIDYISFSVQDSKNYATEGKMGEFLKNYPRDPRGQRRGYSDNNVSFLNNLAERLEKELPANGITKPKTIVYIVYSFVNDIPKVKLHPAILPVTVFHLAETLMDSVYEVRGPENTANHRLSEWAKVTKRIGNHDWAEGKGFIYPRIYTTLVSKFVKTVKKDKMDFDYAHIEAYPNWALDGPKYYLMGRIYWNPEIDPETMLSGFCKDMFGNAASQMKAYFLTLENLNISMNNDPGRERRISAYRTQLSLNEKESAMVKEARGNLDKAYSLAITDDEKKRIELFSKGFKLSEYFFDIYNSKEINENEVAELKNYLKSTVAGDPMILNIATNKDFEEKMNIEVDNIVKYRVKTQNK